MTGSGKPIEEMYGRIDDIRKEPFVLDDAKMKLLGVKEPTVLMPKAIMRYVAGCVTRERERLARIVITSKPPEKLAEAILDTSLDERVFRFAGPEAPIDLAG